MSLQALTGIRVVDLTTTIAGNYASKLLADAGAEVVAVEPPDGSPLRRWSATGSVPPGETGALFHYLHTSKRSVRSSVPSWSSRAPSTSRPCAGGTGSSWCCR